MILYNITIAIDHSVEEEWLQWMKEEHIPEVMDTGKFTEYSLFRVVASGSEQDGKSTSYSVQFYAESMKQVQLYAAIHAPELQQKMARRWPDKLVTFKTLLESIDGFTPLWKSLEDYCE